ncbi:amino acid adenylation domain-containing protein [Streptomyces sp. NPDC001941]|uniref:amino acid adenylation domain-containing protein n=1 Tax=Streptomyces sp. NPDC001941 TaxID=3154659 RepID=UPI0033286274
MAGEFAGGRGPAGSGGGPAAGPGAVRAASLADRFGALDRERRVALLRRLVAAGKVQSVPAVVPPRGADGPVPLSPAQQDLWVYDSLYPGTGALNLCAAYHFDGPVDPEHLAAALTHVRAQHDVLRARITGEPGQLLLEFPETGPLVLEREDLRGSGRDVAAAFDAFRRRPFDLAGDHLMRARYVTTGPDRSTLMLGLHHIVTDWWSFDVLQAEFAEAYRAVRDGRPPALARPAVQYADFASWQGELAESGVLDARLDFWREYLAGPPGPLTVPGGPSGRPGAGVAQVRFRLEEPVARAVRALARERRASVYVVLMAAFAVLAHRLTGAGDLVLGTPTANRSARGLERVIGYVMNAVPTRWRIRPGDSFEEVLAGFTADFPRLMAHADVPVGRIVSAVAPERDAGRSPLFRWVFMHLARQRSVATLREFSRPERIHTGGEHDLVAVVRDAEDGSEAMDASFEVRAELFDPALVERWADCFAQLLREVTRAPGTAVDDLVLLPPGERDRLLAAGRGPAAPAPSSLPDLVARRAAGEPGAVALEAPELSLTYAGLSDRTDRLAALLVRHGAGPHRRVALLLGRGPLAVVAALAVQRAGAAHVPVDPDYPAARVRATLADARPALLVTDDPEAAARALKDAVGAADVPVLVLDERAYDEEPLPRRESASGHPAYVIYTSGSTGAPKGVVVPHAGIAALAGSLCERYGLGPDSRVLQLGSPAFDIWIGELCMAFGSGGTLVLPGPGALAGPELARVLTERAVTFTMLPPSVLATLPEGPYPALRALATGAEACPPGLVERWSAGGRRVHNAYGPTESTVAATLSGPAVADGTAPPLGTPVAGTRAYVLDARLRPLPAGVRGELYVAGEGLALGYHGLPGATAERFVADPFGPPGARMYRTGDLVRLRADGALDFLGRADDQLKVRGLRVEPGEVAAAVAAHPAVDRAVVAGHGSRLVAYVTLRQAGVGPGELLARAAALLPAHLVPSDAVVLDALPLLPNGKVDRAALPAPGPVVPGARRPATGREEALCALFAEVLGLERVGAEDDFFRLGGDSIMAILLAGRARAAGLAFGPHDVFLARTPAGLAVAAREARTPAAAGWAEAGRLPLTPVMRWWREQGGDRSAFTQSMLFPVEPGTGEERLRAAVAGLAERHGSLRIRLLPGDEELEVAEPGVLVPEFVRVDASGPQDLRELAAGRARAARLDPYTGPALRAAWLDAGPDRPGGLLLTAHHLAVDGVSWRVLGPDLALALAGGEPPAPGLPFRAWALLLRQEALHEDRAEEETAWWEGGLAGPEARIAGGRGAGGTRATVDSELDPELTGAVLGRVPHAFHCGPDAVLLTALATACARWRGDGGGLLVNLEGHGREELSEPVDVSRTAGWFTTQYPVRLDPGDAATGPGEALKRVKEQLRAVPRGGLGWGLLRYLNPGTAPRLAALPVPDVRFNYLGRLSGSDVAGGELLGGDPDGVPLGHALEVDVVAVDGRLCATWSYPRGLLDAAEVERLAALWGAALADLAAHAADPEAGGHTASDFPLVDLSPEQLDALELDL